MLGSTSEGSSGKERAAGDLRGGGEDEGEGLQKVQGKERSGADAGAVEGGGRDEGRAVGVLGSGSRVQEAKTGTCRTCGVERLAWKCKKPSTPLPLASTHAQTSTVALKVQLTTKDVFHLL